MYKGIRFFIILTATCSLLFSCGHKTISPENVRAVIVESGFIYESAPFPQCHASTVVETGEGLLAAWFGGTHERNPDVCIYTSEYRNGNWSIPVLVADGIVNDTLRYPCWNPVLYRRKNKDIILYYKVGLSPREWWGVYKISPDGGKTWSSAIQIPHNLLGPIKNKPEELNDGSVLYPTSYETQQEWKVYMEISDQKLKNWQMIEIDNGSFNAIQPAILSYSDGRMQILCRSREKRIIESWSADGGRTWTKMEATSMLNNNSGLDAVSLNNGLQLLICNPIEKGRNKLAVFASNDGKVWQEMIVLEDQPEGEFSYPAIIEGKDGEIHITYTYTRRTIKYVQLKLEIK